MNEDVTLLHYENPSKAAVWQWAMDAWIKSRPYASVDQIIALTDKCADAYAERFIPQENTHCAQVLTFIKGDE